MSGWLEAWDHVPMGFIIWECRHLSGFVGQRQGIAGMLFLTLSMYREGKRSNKAPNYKTLMRAYDSEKARHRATSKDLEGA